MSVCRRVRASGVTRLVLPDMARKGVIDSMAVRVLVKGNEPLEKVLKRLRKICNNEGITREIKRTSVYEKPSEKRRRKERERIKAIRTAKKKALKALQKKKKYQRP
jgi:small subunit ribosomal protein S21